MLFSCNGVLHYYCYFIYLKDNKNYHSFDNGMLCKDYQMIKVMCVRNFAATSVQLFVHHVMLGFPRISQVQLHVCHASQVTVISDCM